MSWTPGFYSRTGVCLRPGFYCYIHTVRICTNLSIDISFNTRERQRQDKVNRPLSFQVTTYMVLSALLANSTRIKTGNEWWRHTLRHNLRRALQIDSTGSGRSEMIVDRWCTVYASTTRRRVASASLWILSRRNSTRRRIELSRYKPGLTVHRWIAGNVPINLKFALNVTHPHRKTRISTDFA